MTRIDVIKICHESISQISKYVEGSYLYVDAGCIESFQVMGAFEIFIELGVQSIYSLESVNTLEMVSVWGPNSDSIKKVVVMTSRFLSDAHRYILRCLSTHQNVHYCTIFTSLSEASHSACTESPLGPDAFHEYECLLVQDFDELIRKHKGEYAIKENIPHMADFGNGVPCENVDMYNGENSGRKLTVSVQHFPLLLCPLSPTVFVLPAEGSIAEACLSYDQDDSLSSGLPPVTYGPSCGDEALPGATLTAHFLYDIAVKMDLKLEVFSLGILSRNVGNILTDMSSLYDVGRRKQSAGLLLIDRTLDLLTPCCHGDSLVDRIFSSLPHNKKAFSPSSPKPPRGEHGIRPLSVFNRRLDLKIPLDFLYDEEYNTSRSVCYLMRPIEAFLKGFNSARSSRSDPLISAVNILTGSLLSAHNLQGTLLLDGIMEKRTKNAALLVTERVRKIMADKCFTEGEPGLTHMLREICKREESLLKHKGVILMAAATLTALEDRNRIKWNIASNAEKLLTASAGETSQNLATRIHDLLSKSGQKSQESKQGLSFEDMILLVVVGYILAGENFPNSGSDGPFSWIEENSMKKAVVDAVLENTLSKDVKLKFISGLTEELEENMRRRGGSGEAEAEISNRPPPLGDFDDDDGWGSWGDEDDGRGSDTKEYDGMQLKLELRDRVDNLFRYLHRFAKVKRGNGAHRGRRFSLGGSLGGGDYPETSGGLLGRLLVHILRRQEVDGIEYHSSSVGRLFKSGFGRFGLSQTKTSIGDQSIIIIFVIGGINGVEVQEAREALSMCGREDVQLIICGTTFLTPNAMMDMLLGDSSFL